MDDINWRDQFFFFYKYCMITRARI
jgi:hypothetical protein